MRPADRSVAFARNTGETPLPPERGLARAGNRAQNCCYVSAAILTSPAVRHHGHRCGDVFHCRHGLRGNMVMAAVSVAIAAVVLVFMIDVGPVCLDLGLLANAAPASTRRKSGRQPAGLAPVAALLAALLAVLPAVARATEAKPVFSGSGLKIEVRVSSLENGGYRPLLITITPTKPPPANRTLTFEFQTQEGWYFIDPEHSSTSVLRNVEIPAGSGPIRATLLVPRTRQWSNYSVAVKEGGVALPGMATGGSPAGRPALQ